MKVNVLATCIEDSRLWATLLVFHTIRKGFPTAEIVVYGNGLNARNKAAVNAYTNALGFGYRDIPRTPHGEWIEKLVANSKEPFWICDTDVIFFDAVEKWFDAATLFAGSYEPQFHEPWTGTTHMARLHPSLMFFNPAALRAAIRGWPQRDPFFGSVNHNLFTWSFVPERGSPIKFYDTCSGLYHALGGTEFTEAQHECFAHLISGTYAHLAPYRVELTAAHIAAVKSDEFARELRKGQRKWYADHANALKSNPPSSNP